MKRRCYVCSRPGRSILFGRPLCGKCLEGTRRIMTDREAMASTILSLKTEQNEKLRKEARA